VLFEYLASEVFSQFESSILFAEYFTFMTALRRYFVCGLCGNGLAAKRLSFNDGVNN